MKISIAKNDYMTSLLILGGQENALSITRSLGRKGVHISVAAREDCSALNSRYCKAKFPYALNEQAHVFWSKLLLNNDNKDLHGSLIFVCSDDAIEFIAKNRCKLQKYYKLEQNDPIVQLDMLDKQKTLTYANDIGCPAPQFWNVKSIADVDHIKADLVFPVIIKPIHTHIFARHYKRKLFVSETFENLREKALDALTNGLEIMICEMIPGPDDLLCSYYTYIDENGDNLFKFTKKVIRRFPALYGNGCYHISSWEPEAADLGEKFFRGINLKGLGNIEFKRDLRDGKLKVIECNARFTAAQELLNRSGMDISEIIYLKLTRGKKISKSGFKENIRLWYPEQDFYAYLELSRRGELSFLKWIKSILHRQNFPYFQLQDTLPSISQFTKSLPRYKKSLTRRMKSLSSNFWSKSH